MKFNTQLHPQQNSITSQINVSQLLRLRDTAEHAYKNSLYWKNSFDRLHINPREMSLSDFSKLPVISKNDIQRHTQDMVCADRESIVDYVCTSGTTSEPIIIPLTLSDLDRLAENEYQAISQTGATKSDVFQICTTLDKQFMAGMAYFLGLRKLQAGIIRMGVESLEKQWQSIFQTSPTYLIAVPSFVVKLISFAIDNNIDYKRSSVKKIICIGENIRNEGFELNTLGDRISKLWDVKLYSTYAATEMGTAFTECDFGIGGHQNHDLLITEVLDEQNTPVAFGTPGELTITTLGIRGMPLFRYKTGDICTLHNLTCDCGSSSFRISPILGRVSQRIKYKGTTFYVSAIGDVVQRFEGVHDYMTIIEKNNLGTDDFTIYVALDSEGLLAQIKDKLKTTIRVNPKIIQLESLLPLRKQYKKHNQRKIARVIDLR